MVNKTFMPRGLAFGKIPKILTSLHFLNWHGFR
jgi:hypothetical protein